LDNRYYIGNVAIYTLIDGTGFRVVYPTKKLPNGQQIPIFYPIDKDIAKEIQQLISEEATKLLRPKEPNKTRYVFGAKNPEIDESFYEGR